MPAPGSDLHITRRWVIGDTELSERFTRSSGPGGQGVNTTASRVELSFDVAHSSSIPDELRKRVLARLQRRLASGVLTITASEHREQRRNREAARARLVATLREAAAPPPRRRRPTKPTRAAQERRIAAKKHRGRLKRSRGGSGGHGGHGDDGH